MKINTLVLTLLVTCFTLGTEAQAFFGKKEEAKPQQAPAPTFDISKGFSSIAEKSIPAVVNISTTGLIESPKMEGQPGVPQDLEDFFRRFFDQQERPRRVQALGSGFIIQSDGKTAYVVTNYHVVADAKKITIFLSDKTELEATLFASDERTDIALLKVNTESLPAEKRNLPTLEWADSDHAKVGEWIFACGNPFGLFDSFTAGIISSKGRNIMSGRGGPNGSKADYVDDFIQHDAAINMGNSGGPLLNTAGQVVGINTAIYSPTGGSIGLGFAIPSNLAKHVVGQLIEFGRTRRGWLGVRMQPVDDSMAENLKLGKYRGVIIGSVAAGSPSEAAGLKAEDIIVEYDGIPIIEDTRFQRLVGETPIGKVVPLKILRPNQQGAYDEISTTVTIGEFELSQDKTQLASAAGADKTQNAQQPIEVLGMKLTPLTPEWKRRFKSVGAENLQGLMILNVDYSSVANEVGLKAGDVIIKVNQTPVISAEEFKDIVKKSQEEKKKNVTLRVWRDDGQDARFITLRIEEEEAPAPAQKEPQKEAAPAATKPSETAPATPAEAPVAGQPTAPTTTPPTQAPTAAQPSAPAGAPAKAPATAKEAPKPAGK